MYFIHGKRITLYVIFAYNRYISLLTHQKGNTQMNDKLKAAVIGGDMRQSYLVYSLLNVGFEVFAYGIKGECQNLCPTLSDALKNADFAVLPFPVSPDGVFLNAICDECNIRLDKLFDEIKNLGITTVIGGGFKSTSLELAKKRSLNVFDYGADESVKIKNALCTAEGAIEMAMRELPINLSGSRCAILGYGRIGRILASKIHLLGARVTVYARKSEAMALAESEGIEAKHFNTLEKQCENFDIIFNTVPARVLEAQTLSKLRNDCIIIDLASSPGGVDFVASERLGLNVIWALSLPGKCSPKSAAQIICDCIAKYISESEEFK